MTTGQFLPSERELLINAPHWVYAGLVAADRGSVTTRLTEAKALEKFLAGYKTKSPLVKEIIAGQQDADDKIKGTLEEAESRLQKVNRLLKRKVSEDEGNAVRDLLMQAGEVVANAAREALFGEAESRREEEALGRIEAALSASEADKRKRRQAAEAVEAQKRAQEAREAKARATAKRKREEAAQAEAEKKAEAARKAREAEAKRLAAEAEAKRKEQEAEAKRLAAEAGAKRKARQAEAKKLAAEAEAKRKEQEAEAKREAQRAEARRLADEAEAKKRAEEAEAQKAAEAAAKMRIYVVKPGDTLSGIAKEMYGKAGRWREIYEANRDRIENPNLIRPGWKLRIPD